MPMPSDSRPRSPLLLQFLRLLVWVRERPCDYCATVGELEEFLASLYEICATSDGQVGRLRQRVSEALLQRGLASRENLLTLSERGRGCAAGEPAMTKIIAFWTEFDRELGFPSLGDAGVRGGEDGAAPVVVRPK
jgi:hypothetical protein